MPTRRVVGALVADLLGRGARERRALPPLPESTLEQVQQAEQLLPGLREKMERSGYSEQELADLVDEKVAAVEIPSLRPQRRSVLPSQRPVGFCVMLLVLAVLGYFGLAGYHTSRHFPRGALGALIAAGAGLAVILVSEIAGRVQRSRGRRV